MPTDFLKGIYSPYADKYEKAYANALVSSLATVSAVYDTDSRGSQESAGQRISSSMVGGENLLEKAVAAVRKANHVIKSEDAIDALEKAQRIYVSPGKGDRLEAVIGKMYDSSVPAIKNSLREQGISISTPEEQALFDQRIVKAIDTLLRESNDPKIKKVLHDVSINYSDVKGIDLNKQNNQFQQGQASRIATAPVKPAVEIKEAKFIGKVSDFGLDLPGISPDARVVDNASAEAIDGHDEEASVGILIPLSKLDPTVPSSDKRGVLVNPLSVTGKGQTRISSSATPPAGWPTGVPYTVEIGTEVVGTPRDVAGQLVNLSQQTEEVYKRLQAAYAAKGLATAQLVASNGEIVVVHSARHSSVKSVVNRRTAENRGRVRFAPYRQAILPKKGRSNEMTPDYAKFVSSSVDDAVKAVEQQVEDYRKEYENTMTRLDMLAQGVAGTISVLTVDPVTKAKRAMTTPELEEEYSRRRMELRDMFQVGVTFDHPENIHTIPDSGFRDIFDGSLTHSQASANALRRIGIVVNAGDPISAVDPVSRGDVYHAPSIVHLINNAILGVGYRKELGAGTPEYGALQNQVYRDVASATLNRYVNVKKFLDRNGATANTADFEEFLKYYQQEVALHPQINTNANVRTALALALAANSTNAAKVAAITRDVNSLYNSASGEYDLAAVDVNYHGNKSGVMALDIKFKKGMVEFNQKLQTRPTAKTVLLKNFLDLKQLEQKFDYDMSVIGLGLQGFGFVTVGGKPEQSFRNILYPTQWRKGPKYKADMVLQEHQLKKSLEEYFSKREVHRILHEFSSEFTTAATDEARNEALAKWTKAVEIGSMYSESQMLIFISEYERATSDAARQAVFDRWKNLDPKAVHYNRRYQAQMYAQAKALAQHAVLKDLVGKYELNPFTFNNVMRAELVSVVLGQGIQYLNPALFVYGVPAAVAWKLLKPFVPYLATIVDQVPFFGVKSIWRKRYKEIIPHFANPGAVYDKYLINVLPGALDRVSTSLLDYVKVASHLWTRTEEGSHVVWNLGYSYNRLTYFLFGHLHDAGTRFFNSPAFQLRLNDPTKKVRFWDWYKAYFFGQINKRKLKGDEDPSGIVGSVVTASVIGIFRALAMKFEELLGLGIKDSLLFPDGVQQTIQGIKDFNSNLAKTAGADEGFANATKLGAFDNIAKIVGKTAYYIRGLETFSFEAIKAGVRGAIAGGITYIFTGGNAFDGWLNFGIHTTGRFIMNFPTNYFITTDATGALQYTNRISRLIHEGKADAFDPRTPDPTSSIKVGSPYKGIIGGPRTFLSKWAEAMAPAPSTITIDQYHEWARKYAVPDKPLSDTYGAYKHLTSGDLTAQNFKDFIDKTDKFGNRPIEHIAKTEFAARGEFGSLAQEANRYMHTINPATHANWTFDEWASRPADSLHGFPPGHTNLEGLKEHIITHGARLTEIAGTFPKTAEYMYQVSRGADHASQWDLMRGTNGKTNLELRRAEWENLKGRGGYWKAVREEFDLGSHVGNTMKGFYHHIPLKIGAGEHFFGKFLRPFVETGMTAATIFVIVGNYNLPLAFGIAGGYFAWDFFIKNRVSIFFRDNIGLKGIVEKFDTISTHFDPYFKTIEHVVGKSVDILWYAQLSQDSGPIHPLLDGINNTFQGTGQALHGIGKLFTGDETGVYDILTGSFQAATGLFNVLGIGFGITGIYAAIAFPLGLLGILPEAFLGLNPIALIATGLIVGIDVFTGGAVSRWIIQTASNIGQAIWNWAGPWLLDVLGANAALTFTIAGFAVLGGVLGAAAWFLLPAVGLGVLLPFIIGGAVIGGIIGWAVYTWWPGASGWINGLFAGITAIAGLLSFAISFLFLFRRKNLAEVVIGIFMLAFSLAEVGALATFPIFTYTDPTTATSSGAGYGSLGSAACPYQGGTVATCNQGNQDCLILGCSGGWSDPGHTYGMATDLGPNGGSQTIVSSFDGTVVNKLYPIGCDWGLGELRIAIDPTDLAGGTGQLTGNKSDVAIEYIHLAPSVGIGDIVKKGQVIGQLVAYTGKDSCYGGPHLHTTINYFNRQSNDLLREYVSPQGVPYGCPAYNSLSVWLANNCVKVASYTPYCVAGQDLGTTFGCEKAPVNGPDIKTAQNAPKSFPGVGACPLNNDVQTKIQSAASKTNVPPALLAAELEYTTNQFGGASIFNDPASASKQFITHNSEWLVSKSYDVARVGPLGIFTDILSNADLKSKLSACGVSGDLQNDPSLQDNLIAAGLILNKMLANGSSVPTSYNACGTGNTMTATDAAIKSAIQDYVCRGNQSTYPSCAANESSSVDALYTFFGANCFGAASSGAAPKTTGQ